MEKTWLIRVKRTASYHRDKKKLNINHTLRDTARELNRSIGSISEDLLVATWLRTHNDEIEKCKTLMEALEFIRNRKRSLAVEDFDD